MKLNKPFVGCCKQTSGEGLMVGSCEHSN